MPNTPDPDMIQPDTIRKILVIHLAPFGDVFLTTAYFPLLKERFPKAELVYLVKEPFQKIVEDHPFIDRILLLKRNRGIRDVIERIRLFGRVFRERFDLVIDQQDLPSTQEIVLFSRARYRLGYDDKPAHWVYNLRAKRGPVLYSASERFAILQPLGLGLRPYQLYFTIRPEDEQRIDTWMRDNSVQTEQLVCISPGSPVAWKKWPAEHFARLADLIQERLDHRVVLLWGPGELEDAKRVMDCMKTQALLAPDTSLREAVALIRRCRMLICNDGGLNHLAATTQTPTLAIFGITHPKHWSPAGACSDRHHHLFNPDADSRQDAGFGITPESVLEKTLNILQIPDGEAA